MIHRYINNNKSNLNKRRVEYIYKYKNGTVVTNKAIIEYAKTAPCPPSYSNVVIDPNKRSKYICIGYDATKRKQYKRSKYFEDLQNKRKFCTLINLGNKLKDIRDDYQKLIEGGRMSMNKIIAIILSIIEVCNFRIGTLRCKTEFKTYGLSTLIKKHVKIKSNDTAYIEFLGKKKQKNKCLIKDPVLIKTLQEITRNISNNSNSLWTYVSSNGNKKDVTALEINNYLKKYDKSITAKVFRTWAANKLFIASVMKKKTIPKTDKERKKRLTEVFKEVSKKMLHTAAMYKKEYLCPDLRELYQENPKLFKKLIYENKKTLPGLDKSESALMNFLNEYYDSKFCKNINNNKNKNNKNNINNNNKC